MKTKKQRKEEKHLKLKNKKIIKKYPWLKPYNVWSGKPLEDYKYEFTFADDIPKGWLKCFGWQMIEEIDKVLKEEHSTIFIEQIKEKYGSLRFYCSASERVQKIVNDYEIISENVCIGCGKPDVYMTDAGWILPLCEKCFAKRNKSEHYEKFKTGNNKIPDFYEVKRFSKDGDTIIRYDISEKVEKIRKKYKR